MHACFVSLFSSFGRGTRRGWLYIICLFFPLFSLLNNFFTIAVQLGTSNQMYCLIQDNQVPTWVWENNSWLWFFRKAYLVQFFVIADLWWFLFVKPLKEKGRHPFSFFFVEGFFGMHLESDGLSFGSSTSSFCFPNRSSVFVLICFLAVAIWCICFLFTT